MIRDELIAMAREAGFRTGQINLSTGDPAPFIAPANGTSCMVELERFAALVAAKAAAAERETCACIALINGKDAPTQEERDMAWAIALAIRARSKA